MLMITDQKTRNVKLLNKVRFFVQIEESKKHLKQMLLRSNDVYLGRSNHLPSQGLFDIYQILNYYCIFILIGQMPPLNVICIGKYCTNLKHQANIQSSWVLFTKTNYQLVNTVILNLSTIGLYIYSLEQHVYSLKMFQSSKINP